MGAGWASDVCDAFWALELCAMPFGVRVEPPKLKRLRKLDIGCLRWTRRDQQQLKACSRNGLRSRRVKVESEVQSVRCSGQTGEPGKRAKKIRPFPTLVEPQQTPHIRKRATSRVTNSSAHECYTIVADTQCNEFINQRQMLCRDHLAQSSRRADNVRPQIRSSCSRILDMRPANHRAHKLRCPPTAESSV